MNIPETADLIELLAAANVLNRLDPKTPEVWAAALCDLEYRDCMQAAARLIRTTQWVKIADVRDTVHEIRADRIRNANLVYDGNPDETGTESARNLRALVDAAGDGHLPPRTITAALDPGHQAEPTARGRAILDAVGQHFPAPRQGVVNVLAISCPICHARPGRTCQSRRKKHRADVHPARLDDARRIAAGQPPVDRSQAVIEERQRREAAARALELNGASSFIPPTRDEAAS